MIALSEDRKLLQLFLLEFLKTKISRSDKITLLEQQYPFEPEPPEEIAERRGIPDGWIFSESGWCVVIEAKVLLAKLSSLQIDRHLRIARRMGFSDIRALAIVSKAPSSPLDGIRVLTWPQIYLWLKKHSEKHDWAKRAALYMDVAEAKMIANHQVIPGAFTMFAGIPFNRDHPLTYLEAKRVLSLTLDQLRKHNGLQKILRMDPSLPGRPAITGKQTDRVWDFLQLSGADSTKGFTHQPHLTLGLLPDRVEAMVTIPNAINSQMRKRIKDLGVEGFREVISQIVRNLSPTMNANRGVVPYFKGVQRRYPSQKAIPKVDAQIGFDLRTVGPRSASGPKIQTQWVDAAFTAFIKKGHANYQFQLGAIIFTDECEAIRTPKAIELIANCWIACLPLLKI